MDIGSVEGKPFSIDDFQDFTSHLSYEDQVQLESLNGYLNTRCSRDINNQTGQIWPYSYDHTLIQDQFSLQDPPNSCASTSPESNPRSSPPSAASNRSDIVADETEDNQCDDEKYCPGLQQLHDSEVLTSFVSSRDILASRAQEWNSNTVPGDTNFEKSCTQLQRRLSYETYRSLHECEGQG